MTLRSVSSNWRATHVVMCITAFIYRSWTKQATRFGTAKYVENKRNVTSLSYRSASRLQSGSESPLARVGFNRYVRAVCS